MNNNKMVGLIFVFLEKKVHIVYQEHRSDRKCKESLNVSTV